MVAELEIREIQEGQQIQAGRAVMDVAVGAPLDAQEMRDVIVVGVLRTAAHNPPFFVWSAIFILI